MTEDQIKHMVERFLAWKLPERLHPDNGISFTPPFPDEPMRSRHWPVGTNLFDYTQAEAMVRHMLDGLPASPPPTTTLVDETAWLIERDDIATIHSGNHVCLHYYAEHRPSRHYWTPDHMKAKRFDTKEVAEAETNGDPLLRVAEHMWMAMPVDDRETPSGQAMEEFVADVLWHVEQVCGPLSTETCVVAGDDDRTVLTSAIRAALTTAIPLIQAQTEAKIVAFLKKQSSTGAFFADQIEQGKHRG